MNSKNRVRQVLSLILMLGLMLGVVITANANVASPTATKNVCVTLENARADAAAGETVTWTFYNAGTATVAYGPTTTQTDQNGCFEVTGVANDSYDLYIDGDDTLNILSSGITYPNLDTTIDLTASVTLVEGDTTDDNTIGLADVTELKGEWGGDGDGDLDEDSSVGLSDVTLMKANWANNGAALPTAAGVSRNTVAAPSGSATIAFNPGSVASGNVNDVLELVVEVTNASAEEVRSVELLINYDHTKVEPNNAGFPGFETSFGLVEGPSCSTVNNGPNNNTTACLYPDATFELIGPATAGALTINQGQIYLVLGLAAGDTNYPTTTSIKVAELHMKVLDAFGSRESVVSFDAAETGYIDNSGAKTSFASYGQSELAVTMSDAGTSTDSFSTIVVVLLVSVLAAATIVSRRRMN